MERGEFKSKLVSFYFVWGSHIHIHGKEKKIAVRIWPLKKPQLVVERAPKTEVQTLGWAGWGTAGFNPPKSAWKCFIEVGTLQCSP